MNPKSRHPVDSPAIAYFRQHPVVVQTIQEVYRNVKYTGKSYASILASPFLSEIEQTINTPNLFTALGVTETEIRHSRVLAWLHNPTGSHGEGITYLKRFLKLLSEHNTRLIIPADENLKTTIVSTEAKNIDVLIECEKASFVCAIENKIHASQGDGQLIRYAKNLAAMRPSWTRAHVFLTLSEEKSQAPEWINLSYRTTLLRTLGQTPKYNSQDVVTYLLRNYEEWILSNGDPNRKDNLFAVLGLCRHELRHSDLLGWLLTPSAPHGFKDSLARHLFSLIPESSKNSLPANANKLDWSDLQVRREFENVDLLLTSERHQTTIVIENKIHAQERENQLADYQSKLTGYFGHKHVCMVFLDKKGGTSTSPDANNISYEDIRPWVAEQIRNQAGKSMIESSALITSEYLRLLTDHLWRKAKTSYIPPPTVASIIHAIEKKHPGALDSFVAEIDEWQKATAQRLGSRVFDAAIKIFNSSVRDIDRQWFSFVPCEFDYREDLRTLGTNARLRHRVIFYQFFAIPYGDTVSVRKPQFALDIKLAVDTRSSFRTTQGGRLKYHIHEHALKNKTLFNRVSGSGDSKFAPLLNIQLCSYEEAASLEEEQLVQLIVSRLTRFHDGRHSQVVSEIKTAMRTYDNATAAEKRTAMASI